MIQGCAAYGVAATGDVFSDVFAAIAGRTQDGSNASGDVADWLFGLGYTAAAISQALNQVSQTASATDAMRAYAQQERQYLAQQYNQPQQTNWLPLILIGGLLLLASRE